MPFDVIWWIIAAIIGGLTVAFWDDVRERVATWLREHGLSKSVLMDAWIKLDQIIGSIRCKIFTRTHQYGVQKISETSFELDEIKDADVLAELQRRGYVEINIMSQIR